MPNRLISGILFFCACLGIGSAVHAQGLPPLTHQLTPIEAAVAPPLRFKTLDDESVDLAELKGKAAVVNFWATWCPPCRREMGSLERLHQASREEGVEVLAVNIGEDEDTVFSFLGTVEPMPTFKILLDLEGASMETWKVRGLPTTYIIGPDGRVAYRAVGGREFDHPNIQEALVELIR